MRTDKKLAHSGKPVDMERKEEEEMTAARAGGTQPQQQQQQQQQEEEQVGTFRVLFCDPSSDLAHVVCSVDV